MALFVALGGTSYAVTVVTGKNVRDGSLTGKDIKDNSLSSGDVRNGSLRLRDFRSGELATAPGVRGPAGPAGPAGAPGSAIAFARVAANGDVDATASKDIAVVPTGAGDGIYCLNVTAGAAKNIALTIDISGADSRKAQVAGSTVPGASCPAGSDIVVATVQNNETYPPTPTDLPQALAAFDATVADLPGVRTVAAGSTLASNWGTTLAMNQPLGPNWLLNGPGAPRLPVPSKTIGNDSEWVSQSLAKGAGIVNLNPQADILHLITTAAAPKGALRDSAGTEHQLNEATKFCLRPNGCKCPDKPDPGYPKLPRGQAYLGYANPSRPPRSPSPARSSTARRTTSPAHPSPEARERAARAAPAGSSCTPWPKACRRSGASRQASARSRAAQRPPLGRRHVDRRHARRPVHLQPLTAQGPVDGLTCGNCVTSPPNGNLACCLHAGAAVAVPGAALKK